MKELINRKLVPALLLSFSMLSSGLIVAPASAERTFLARDLAPNISALLESKRSDAWFVVTVAGTPDFIQLYGSDGEAFLDFPLFTERQRSKRGIIEEVCADHGLSLSVQDAPNGTQVLDGALPPDAAKIAVILQALLQRVYGAGSDAPLELESNGFALRSS